MTILSAGETVRRIPVTGGVKEGVRAIAARDVAAPVPLDSWPDLVIDLPDSLEAGVRQGQRLGAVSLMDGGPTLITVPLIAAEDVPARSFRSGLHRLFALWPVGP